MKILRAARSAAFQDSSEASAGDTVHEIWRTPPYGGMRDTCRVCGVTGINCFGIPNAAILFALRKIEHFFPRYKWVDREILSGLLELISNEPVRIVLPALMSRSSLVSLVNAENLKQGPAVVICDGKLRCHSEQRSQVLHLVAYRMFASSRANGASQSRR